MSDKLLIVDDEQDILEFASNFFRKRKLNVLCASDGEEAIKKVITEQPKLVLLDITMQGIDGIEILKRIKGLNKEIRVIMVTGREDTEALEKTIELGANGYIHKPLQLDQLEKTVLKIWGENN